MNNLLPAWHLLISGNIVCCILMIDYERFDRVAMTPDATVEWDVLDCPDIGGSMLLAPDCTERVTEALWKATIAVAADPYTRIGPFIGAGVAGAVYEWPSLPLALKVAYSFKPSLAEYDALKANVTLAAGLKRIPDARNDRVEYTAPSYHGAYFPYESEGRGSSVWAMSYEPGKTRPNLPVPIRRTIPAAKQRAAVYKRALEACGGNPANYQLDMGPDNEIFRATSDALPGSAAIGAAALTIVKLDIKEARTRSEAIKLRGGWRYLLKSPAVPS
jgi:hypothetical protein